MWPTISLDPPPGCVVAFSLVRCKELDLVSCRELSNHQENHIADRNNLGRFTNLKLETICKKSWMNHDISRKPSLKSLKKKHLGIFIIPKIHQIGWYHQKPSARTNGTRVLWSGTRMKFEIGWVVQMMSFLGGWFARFCHWCLEVSWGSHWILPFRPLTMMIWDWGK